MQAISSYRHRRDKPNSFLPKHYDASGLTNRKNGDLFPSNKFPAKSKNPWFIYSGLH